MASYILIVGEADRRANLVEAVRDCGYKAALCDPLDIAGQLGQGPLPAAMIVCIEDGERLAITRAVRRARNEFALPVILHADVGEDTRAMADLIELEGDHFLESSVDPDQVRRALVEVLGEGERGDVPTTSPRSMAAVDVAAPRARERTAASWGESPSHPPVPLSDRSGRGAGEESPRGQWHRTLDQLEARIRDQAVTGGASNPDTDDRADEIDLSSLGADSIPSVDSPEVGLDPGESGARRWLTRVESGARRRSRGATRLKDGVAEGPAGESGESGESGDSDESKEPDETGGTEAAQGAFDATRRLDRRARPTETFDRAGSPTVWRPVYAQRHTGTSVAMATEAGQVSPQTDVASILWRLYRDGYSGSLRLIRPGMEKQLWFVGGKLRCAHGNAGSDGLLEGLRRRGMLVAPHYEHARTLRSGGLEADAYALVELGYVKAAEVRHLLSRHVAHIVDTTFAWTDGEWVMDHGDRLDDQIDQIDLIPSFPRFILEGARVRLSAEVSRARLGSGLRWPSCVGASGSEVRSREVQFADLSLDVEGRNWVRSMDGSCDIDELAAKPGTNPRRLFALAYALYVMGLISMRDEPETVAATASDPCDVDRLRIRERLALVGEADYFSILGVSRDVGVGDLERAFGEMAWLFGPESVENSVLDQMADELQAIRRAFDEAVMTLRDPKRRHAYLVEIEGRG